MCAHGLQLPVHSEMRDGLGPLPRRQSPKCSPRYANETSGLPPFVEASVLDLQLPSLR